MTPTIDDILLILNLSRDNPIKPTLEGDILTRIVMWELECLDTDMWRVEILPDGKLRLNDMTLPFLKSRDTMEVFKQDAPSWVIEAIDVLAICDIGDIIPNVGKRISESIYYVTEKKVGL